MKFFCDGLELCDAVLKVVKAISSKNINPILEGIKFTAKDDILTLVATDGELAIEKKVKADVKIEGETVVPGKLFGEYVRKLENETVTVELNEKNQLIVEYTDGKLTVSCLRPEEFPKIQEVNTVNNFSMKQCDFKQLIEKTIFSAATDDSRPILKGCLLEVSENKIDAVALDGYRLAKIARPIISATNTFKLVVPSRSLNEISKLLNDDEDEIVNICYENNHILVQVFNTKIISRLLDGEYLNYRNVIPSQFKSYVIVDKKQFDEALEIGSIVARMNNDNSVRLTIKEDTMICTTRSDVGNDTQKISITTEGEELTNVGFNCKFLRDALKAIDSELVKLCFTTEINPCLLVPVFDDEEQGIEIKKEQLFVVLPLRQI